MSAGDTVWMMLTAWDTAFVRLARCVLLLTVEATLIQVTQNFTSYIYLFIYFKYQRNWRYWILRQRYISAKTAKVTKAVHSTVKN
jgi:hypothetical protein